ncbi:MAG: hypothetical protein R6W68_08035 [Ignavibacteriaceae bacterium]
MTSVYKPYLISLCFFMILMTNQSFSQVAQAFLRFTPGPPAKIEDEYNHNDPNITYWNNYVKSNQLDILEFDLNSIPFYLFSYSGQIVQQYDNSINQWDNNGCIDIYKNPLYGC